MPRCPGQRQQLHPKLRSRGCHVQTAFPPGLKARRMCGGFLLCLGKLGETVILDAFVEDDRRQTPSAGSKYLWPKVDGSGLNARRACRSTSRA